MDRIYRIIVYILPILSILFIQCLRYFARLALKIKA